MQNFHLAPPVLLNRVSKSQFTKSCPFVTVMCTVLLVDDTGSMSASRVSLVFFGLCEGNRWVGTTPYPGPQELQTCPRPALFTPPLPLLLLDRKWLQEVSHEHGSTKGMLKVPKHTTDLWNTKDRDSCHCPLFHPHFLHSVRGSLPRLYLSFTEAWNNKSVCLYMCIFK